MEKNKFINDKREGYWEVYHLTGELWYKGNYINYVKVGYWEQYNNNGKLNRKEFYLY